MQITVVAVLCHQLAGINAPVCREEIIARTDEMHACLFSQPAIADWKANSIFRSDAWVISRVRCVPDDYQVRDAT
jgi:hypothetical protein